MRIVRALVLDERIRTKLPETLRLQKCLDVDNQQLPDTPPAPFRLDPNAFEKGNRLAFAAIRGLADRNLGEANQLSRLFGGKAPSVAVLYASRRFRGREPVRIPQAIGRGASLPKLAGRRHAFPLS